MNCCDDAGKCHGGPGCAARTCAELGVCQSRVPPCPDCVHEDEVMGFPPYRLSTPTDQPAPLFAPGVIEGYRVPVFGTAAQRRELRLWLKAAAVWCVVVGLAAFAAGVVSGLIP